MSSRNFPVIMGDELLARVDKAQGRWKCSRNEAIRRLCVVGADKEGF